MALPTGLIPVYVFVLTVGIATPVTLGAHLSHRAGTRSFGAALRAALLEAGGLYLVGVIVMWAIVRGGSLEVVVITFLIPAGVALLVLMVIPLVVGQQIIQRVKEVDTDTALRFATYAWPITMLLVFGIFIAPGGFTSGDLFSLEGDQICLVGFCGIIVPFAVAVLLELIVAVLGPGFIGSVLLSSDGLEADAPS